METGKLYLQRKLNKCSLVSLNGWKDAFSLRATFCFWASPFRRYRGASDEMGKQIPCALLEEAHLWLGWVVGGGCYRVWKLPSTGTGVPICSLDSVSMQPAHSPAMTEHPLHAELLGWVCGRVYKTPQHGPRRMKSPWPQSLHPHYLAPTAKQEAFWEICFFLPFLLFSPEHGCCSSLLSHFRYF